MAKLYAQAAASVLWLYGTLDAGASTSGSIYCDGYAKLVGGFRSDVVSETGSGFRIEQSFDRGLHWDIVSASCLASASAASAFDIDIIGNAVRVVIKNGAGAAGAIRSYFYTRPV